MNTFASFLLTGDLAAVVSFDSTLCQVDATPNPGLAYCVTFLHLATALYATAAACALCCVFVGTWHFVTAQRFGKDVDLALSTILKRTPSFWQPASQALLSAWFSVFAVGSHIYLLRGPSALCIGLSALGPIFGLATYYGIGTLILANKEIEHKATVAWFRSCELTFDLNGGRHDEVALALDSLTSDEASTESASLRVVLENRITRADITSLRDAMVDVCLTLSRRTFLKFGEDDTVELLYLLNGDVASSLISRRLVFSAMRRAVGTLSATARKTLAAKLGLQSVETNLRLLMKAAAEEDNASASRMLACFLHDNSGAFNVTPLLLASSLGDSSTVARLLKLGADTEAVVLSSDDKDGSTPLCIAAANGHVAVVDLLIGAGACIEAKSTNGYTPFFWAVTCNQRQVVKALIQYGANMWHRACGGITPLYWALQQWRVPDPDTKDERVWDDGLVPPLYVCLKRGKYYRMLGALPLLL